MLFYVGELNALDRRSVAVVCARRCTTVGRFVAFEVALGLAETGCNLVSGLALRIDPATHRGALAAGDGATTAVLGAGFNHLYPRQNTRLAQELLAAGGLLLALAYALERLCGRRCSRICGARSSAFQFNRNSRWRGGSPQSGGWRNRERYSRVPTDDGWP